MTQGVKLRAEGLGQVLNAQTLVIICSLISLEGGGHRSSTPAWLHTQRCGVRHLAQGARPASPRLTGQTERLLFPI